MSLLIQILLRWQITGFSTEPNPKLIQTLVIFLSSYRLCFCRVLCSFTFLDELCKTASLYLPNKCFLKNREDPERICKGTPLACTHHPCPQCPIHGHNLLLPPALSSSTGQAGWGCRSRRLALGICATVSLHQDISHHTQALATCPSPAWERHLWSKTFPWTEVRRWTKTCNVPEFAKNVLLTKWHSFHGLRDL